MRVMRGAVIVAALCVLGLSGCASRSETAAPEVAPVAQPIPANSPLAEVKVGMTGTQVQEILGAPTNQKTYESGKRWIPFYYGADAVRTEWSYKGLGRVVFTGGNVFGHGGGQVQRVDYDPSETGA